MLALFSFTCASIVEAKAPLENPAGANHGWATESFSDKAPITAQEGGACILADESGSFNTTSGK